MSFQATISSADHQLLWTRAISSLSAISDTVRLQFNNERVNISSINTTKTTLFSLSLNSQKFFQEFKLSAGKDLCILIHSKSLALIFKNYRVGTEEVEFFRFTINESLANRRINRSRNKIFIEIMAKNNLKKNYSLDFLKCKDNLDLRIDKTYKDLLVSQSDTSSEEDRIHYLMMDVPILKNFLDMFPPSIEDFKIEVIRDSRKLNLIGFNKQQLMSNSKGNVNKEAQALRQPMSLTIGISLNDILGDNFLETDDEDEKFKKLNIVFRLKDFKSYINLVNSLNFTKGNSRGSDFSDAQINQAQQQQQQNQQGFIELLFNRAGFPLLISKRRELPNPYSTISVTNTLDNVNEEFELMKLDLILMTDFEGDNMPAHENDLVIPNIEILKNDIEVGNTGSDDPVLRQTDFNDFEDRSDDPEPQFVLGTQGEPLPTTAPIKTNLHTNKSRRKFNLHPLLKETNLTTVVTNSTPEKEAGLADLQSVRWNDHVSKLDPVAVNYVESRTESYVRANQAKDQFDAEYNGTGDLGDVDGDALGPTQGVYKVKGLFD